VESAWLWVAAPGACIWLAVLFAPWRPWSTRERLEGEPGLSPPRTGELTVIIPARNEAVQIGSTLATLRGQLGGAPVVLVNDRSTDGTADAARASGLPELRVIDGAPLPHGWTGKLWALEQGLEAVDTALTLLLDADVELENGIVAAMFEEKRRRGVALLSLMATLRGRGFWDRLLLPAFVHFFKLIYPFRLANAPSSRVAAAAGGCVLVDTHVLREIGGFASIRGELIDDCALAARCKTAGQRTWLGLSRSVTSRRRYHGLPGIWHMVSRTAYTQLRYSPLLLALCALVMAAAFWLPLAALLGPDPVARWLAATSVAAMIAAYLPMLRFYRLSPLWALLLPLTGTLYLAMTIDSARRYSRGMRSSWRGRDYAVDRGDR
jgi:hopene-associated glycosyltransferase HpnB